MLVITMLAMAKAAETSQRSDPLVDGLARCLTVQGDAARLTCLDPAARALVDAARSQDVLVIKREDVRRTRRSLFGISGEPGDALVGPTTERIDALETKVSGTARLANDRWSIQLAEGGRWQTTEAWVVGSDPRPGATVSIRRGSLGSYVMKVGAERSVRVRRVN